MYMKHHLFVNNLGELDFIGIYNIPSFLVEKGGVFISNDLKEPYRNKELKVNQIISNARYKTVLLKVEQDENGFS